jgi:hypothetical protein
VAFPEVNEIGEARDGEITADFTRRYTRSWRVLFAPGESLKGPINAFAAVGLNIGTNYVTTTEYDDASFVNSLKAKQEEYDDGRSWIVTATYGPWEPQGETPLSNPVEVESGSVQFERLVDQDWYTGEAVVNSAGDMFDPPLTGDDSRQVLTFVRNEATFNNALALALKDTVNAGSWRGYGPRTVKASMPKASRQYHPQIGFYWRVSYEFHINPEKWDKVILDAGMRRLDPSDATKQRPIVTKDGSPVSSPVPLDGSGAPLAVGGTPVWKRFRVHVEADFSLFNLDNV